MTSRVSFLKLTMETLRRHLTAVLITVLVFVLHLVIFFLNLQNTIQSQILVDDLFSSNSHATDLDYIIENVTELCSPNLGNAILAMLIGVFLAFDFFRYLHSKKETDFYESLPIKKEKRFLIRFISCFGIFLILCSLTIFLELAIVYGTGFGSRIILNNMLWTLLCMIGVFFACWSTTVLAMVMTGHPIIAFLGVGVFSVYVPVILNYLFPVYAGKFFDTYVSNLTGKSKSLYFSPVTLGYKAMYDWNTWEIAEHASYLIGSWIFALVVGFIAYILFLRRPSETAGRAMAFEKINFIIRFMLVIPLSLYAGVFLQEMSYESSTAWLVFGITFASILLHAIIEAIFQFDIKAIVSKKRQLVLAIVMSLAFVFVFWIDLFHYDDYMPRKSDLQSVKMDSYMFGYVTGDWDYLRDGLTDDAIDDALNVVNELRKSDYSDEDVYLDSITVTYKLKSGRETRRRYQYNQENVPETLDKLYETKDFKDDLCVLYHMDAANISTIDINNGLESMVLNLSEKEKQEFVRLYLKEYTAVTLSEHLDTPAVYNFTIAGTIKNGSKNQQIKESYYILPTYKDTIAFVEKHGAKTFHNSPNITLKNLEIHAKTDYNDGRLFIDNEAQLNALRPYMMQSIFYEYKYYTDTDDEIYCNLKYELNGSINYTDVYIKQSDIDKILK